MSSGSRRRFLRDSIGFGATSAVLAGASARASSADQVAGANERIRVALIGCGGQGSGDLRDFLKLRGVECVALCDVDDAQTASRAEDVVDGHGQAEAGARDARLPPRARPQGHRRRDRRHARPLARAADDPGLPGGQGRLRREAARRSRIGEGRVMVNAARKHDRVVQMGTQQRSATALHGRGRVREERQARQDPPGARVGLPRLEGQDPGGARQRPAPDGVDYDMWLGPAPDAAVQQEPLPLQLPLVLGLRGRPDDRLGRAHDRHRQLGMGIKAPSARRSSVGGKFGYPDDAMETPDTQQVLWDYPDFSMIWEHALGIGRGPEAPRARRRLPRQQRRARHRSRRVGGLRGDGPDRQAHPRVQAGRPTAPGRRQRGLSPQARARTSSTA